MKLKLILLFLIAAGLRVNAQQKDTVVTLDQLRAPSSPAFNMLGISPDEIERPKNPTDFALSLGNASNNFSAIPQSYAVEVAPFWVLGGKSSFEQFIDNKNIGDNMKQTAVFSLGTTTANSIKDQSQYRQVALALKFSMFRGEVGKEFQTWKDTLHKYQTLYTARVAAMKDSLNQADAAAINALREMARTDPSKTTAVQAAIKALRDASEVKAHEIEKVYGLTKNKRLVEKLSELSKQTSFKRYGFKMDWAAGTVLDYPDSTFNQTYLSKFATWLTIGHEGKYGSNILFLVRYAANFNRFYRNDLNQLVNDVNIGNLDMGLRVFKDFTDKFTLSLEYLNRSPFYSNNNYAVNKVTSPSRTDKYDISLNYKVGKNQNISFTYGKNFDNKVTKAGNLIAAINFMMGFGSARGINNSNEK
jgi:hypothetical protein